MWFRKLCFQHFYLGFPINFIIKCNAKLFEATLFYYWLIIMNGNIYC